jgi:hypothetical protein
MKVKLVIGDWSSDGHGHHEDVILESNKSVEEIQEAYKKSCKLTGLSFNHNQDFTGLNLNYDHPEYSDRKIAVEYEDCHISELATKILKEHGIDVWEGFDDNVYDKEEDDCPIDGVDHFVELWTKFVKLSLPDLELTVPKKGDKIPVINGYWDDNLNVQFGYGLFE